MALTLTKRQVTLKLNNGVDTQGNVKTVSVSFPAISLTATQSAIETGIAAIMTSLSACLSKTVHAKTLVETYTIATA